MSKRARENAENKRIIFELAEALAKRKAGQEGKAAAKVASLPEALEQEVLQLLSVIFAPASKTAISSCLNRAGIRNDNGRQFIPPMWIHCCSPSWRKGWLFTT